MTAKPRILSSLFIAFALITLACNMQAAMRQYVRATFHHQKSPPEPGYQYADLKSRLPGVKQLGYITNRDLASESLGVLHFLRAQYMLAPIVLRINDFKQPFLLMDHTSILISFDTISDLKAETIYVNPHQKVLAHQP